VVAFYDRVWNSDWSNTIGFSLTETDNSAAQAPSAFSTGRCALVNLLNHSVENLMWDGDLQHAKRENFSDGCPSDNLRVQFSSKYNSGYSWRGKS